MTRILNIIFAVATLIMVAACKDSGRQTEGTTSGAAPMTLTADDTMAVNDLVRQYLDLAVAGDYDSAASMLKIVDDTTDQGVWELDEQEHEHAVSALKLLPISSYYIEGYDFRAALDNDVKVKVSIDSTMSTYMVLKPVRYLGKWVLTLSDSFN